jgi:hypothetical protein
MAEPKYSSTNQAPEQMLPTTIDEVIAELESIMDACEQSGSSLGYFTALYHKVTCRVRDGIANNEFGDGERVERLDVTFANRYIEAWHQYQSGKAPTASWMVSFDARRKRRTLVLQHLLLGINAHINLDLGIAAAEVAREDISEIRKDFAAINGILAMLTGDVMNVLRRVSPLLSLLGLHQSRYNSILIQFSISNARDGAWCFAEELFNEKDSFTQIIEARDKSISDLAKGLVSATGLLRVTLWVIRLFEWHKPARIIRELRSTTPAVIKTKKAPVAVPA